MSTMAKYKPFTPEAYNRGRKASSSKSAFIRKLPVGRSQFRLLPAKQGEVSPFVEIHQHWVDVEGQNKRMPINCPQLMANQPCPLCLRKAQLESTGDPADAKVAEALAVNSSIFVNVIDRACPEEGVKVWQLRPSVLNEILDVYDMHGKPDFTDPFQGMDIIVNRTGTGRQDTRYKVIFGQPSALSDDAEQIDTWVDSAKPLSKTYAKVLSPQQIAQVIQTGKMPTRNRRNSMPAMGQSHQVGALTGKTPTNVQAPQTDDAEYSDDEPENY